MSPPPTYFPLRWESTGDQWWYASPVDYAAANGHYDLVRELLRLDGNNLIKLASLRRIRRLETVWDDEERFHHVAKNRAEVARKLLSECETQRDDGNSLVGSGYGGWLLYTAASAGDLCFVRKLLERDPLLVFGEGEYGITDVLYAAARSRSSEVFKVVLDFAIFPRFSSCDGEESTDNRVPEAYRSEITNRAVHALARGGSLEMFREFLEGCSDDVDDVFAYRDNRGSTVVHAAAARGQVEIIRYLTSTSASADATTTSKDNQGNTPLHVAAHRGHTSAVEALILAFPSSIHARNDAGETFLHTAITGFQTPGFQRLDRQIELTKKMLIGDLFEVNEIVNVQTHQGLTPLTLAVTLNVHADLVDLLMKADSAAANVRDSNGRTPLDVLRKQPPASSSSEILTRRLISAGGIFSSRDGSARRAIASHIRRQSAGSSPGTSFRINDAEIFLHTGLEGTPCFDDVAASACYSPARSQLGSTAKVENVYCASSEAISAGNSSKIGGSVASAARRLRRLMHWPGKKSEGKKLPPPSGGGGGVAPPAISLRERFSSSNKRAFSVRSSVQSPKEWGGEKVAAGGPRRRRTRSASFSKVSVSSSQSSSVENYEVSKASSSSGACCKKVDNRLINRLLGFDGDEAASSSASSGFRPYDVYERSVLSAA